MTKTFELLLPAHWACALMYGDPVNPDLDEQAEQEEEVFFSFCANELPNCDCVDVGEDTQFCKYHEATGYGVLACDCVTYTFRPIPCH